MNKIDDSSPFFSRKNMVIIGLLALVYLMLSWLLIGYKADQLYLIILFLFLYYLSKPTRKFIVAFSIYIVFWILFDFMKAFPNYKINAVHIQDLYFADKQLFGIQVNGVLLTLNEYFLQHKYLWVDILTGFFYLCWMPLPLAFSAYLLYKRPLVFYYFSLCFLLVNIVGWVMYYSLPAAPPWYIQQYGFSFNAHTPGNTAGLESFDRFFNVGIFKQLYTKSSNVFAAMPSLHASYPIIALFYGIKYKVGLGKNLIITIIMLGTWFAAVYSSHHYVMDVLGGIICALITLILFHLFLKTKWLNNFIASYQRLVN